VAAIVAGFRLSGPMFESTVDALAGTLAQPARSGALALDAKLLISSPAGFRRRS
jgi:hypothetical protein